MHLHIIELRSSHVLDSTEDVCNPCRQNVHVLYCYGQVHHPHNKLGSVSQQPTGWSKAHTNEVVWAVHIINICCEPPIVHVLDIIPQYPQSYGGILTPTCECRFLTIDVKPHMVKDLDTGTLHQLVHSP